MSKRSLLLCFDAFGTLFRPRWPIAQQYASIARESGLDGFSDADVATHFRTAFRKQSLMHPNYGKATGMGDKNWWNTVIRNTFAPLLPEGQEVPEDLPRKIRRRFASREGYTPVYRLPMLLRQLKKKCSPERFDRIVVGVITNSDPRVPKVLSTMKLVVSPVRCGAPLQQLPEQWPRDPATPEMWSIDFCVTSYDSGFEKPDQRIFRSAEDLLDKLLMHYGKTPMSLEPDLWTKLYIGDEYEKDVLGAVGAGWDGMLVGKDPRYNEESEVPLVDISMDSCPHEVLTGGAGFRAQSIAEMVEWLTGVRMVIGDRQGESSFHESEMDCVARRVESTAKPKKPKRPLGSRKSRESSKPKSKAKS